MKTLKYLFSSILSLLPTGEGPGGRLYCLLVTLFLFSCSRDDAQQDSTELTIGPTIRKEITLQTVPMEPAQGAGTTRTTTPLTEDEAKIHSLWVLQFSSKLIKKTAVDVSEIADGKFFFDFEELSGGGEITVYLLANLPANALDGLTENSTTLDTFESSSLSVTALTEATMKANGLPMIASQSFDYTTSNPATFTLKSLLAKVSFQYATISSYTYANVNLYAHNLATAVPVMEPTAGTAMQHPAGIDYTSSLPLVSNATYSGTKTVCYLPENLAGRVAAITKDTGRGGSNVPIGATYMRMSQTDLNATSYNFYLGDGTSSDFNMQRNHQYTFNMRLRGADTGDKRVDVAAINLSLKADGVTSATANCYIVTKDGAGNSFYFDATKRGNGYENASDKLVSDISYSTLPKLTDATEARVLWQTGTSASDLVISEVRFENGKVTFKTGSAVEGNAVIGIFASSAANADCLWSWHIWKLSSDNAPKNITPNPTKMILYPEQTETEVVMMDRNLGAYKTSEVSFDNGLLYQWGRKDPFPSFSSSSPTSAEPDNLVCSFYNNSNTYRLSYGKQYAIQTVAYSEATTESWAVKHPGVFIIKNRIWWAGASAGFSFWGNGNNGRPSFQNDYNINSGTKSIYDPCPIGYRVPPQDTWDKQTESGTKSGQYFMILNKFHDTHGFYKAGYRDYNDGRLSTRYNNYYWSSSMSNSAPSVSALFFSDSGTTVNPKASVSNATGCSVRCVSE